MEDFDESLVAILTRERGNFSAMARGGYRKYGRGAIFVWESEGKGAFTTFRAGFLPLSDHAFHKSGPEPKRMAKQYNPDSELVAVFVTADEQVHTVRIEMAPEPFTSMEV